MKGSGLKAEERLHADGQPRGHETQERVLQVVLLLQQRDVLRRPAIK